MPTDDITPSSIEAVPEPLPGAVPPGPPGVEAHAARRGLRFARPLKLRDFRLLFIGSTVSLIGDGAYTVALAWQTYAISNTPTALAIVGLGASIPPVVLLLLAGAIGDRVDRRHQMIAADVLRAAVLAGIGALSLGGSLKLWHLVAASVLIGVGDSFFYPVTMAILPDVVPKDLLVEASSLNGFSRTLAMRFAGPAAGGALVALAGTGTAFLADAGTFVVSAVAVGMIRGVTRHGGTADRLPLRQEIAEGFRFVRATPWIWATIVAAGLSLLLFFGPMHVLLPYIVKNRLGGSAADFGTVLATGGIGALVVGLVVGQLGLPARRVTLMYGAFVVGELVVALIPLADKVWQVALVVLVMDGVFVLGDVVWSTMRSSLVPPELLSRVSSLDFLVSFSLLPLSFAVVGPIAGVLGAGPTLAGGAILGAAAFGVFLLVPGVRDPEKATTAGSPSDA